MQYPSETHIFEIWSSAYISLPLLHLLRTKTLRYSAFANFPNTNTNPKPKSTTPKMAFLSSLFSSKSSPKTPYKKPSTPSSKKPSTTSTKKPAPQAPSPPKKPLSLQNKEKDGKRYKSSRPKNAQPVGHMWLYDKSDPRASALDRKFGGEAGASRGRAKMVPLRAEYRKP